VSWLVFIFSKAYQPVAYNASEGENALEIERAARRRPNILALSGG